MYSVKKRNGKVVKFEIVRISDAIKLAFDALEKQYNQDIIDFLALKVTAAFESKIKNDANYRKAMQEIEERLR
jgi:ribonucleoside-triphosphate reductase